MFLSRDSLIKRATQGSLADPRSLVIDPFLPEQVNSRTLGRNVMSFGPGADGYDVRCSRTAHRYRKSFAPLDPVNVTAEDLEEIPVEVIDDREVFVLNPFEFALIAVEERVQIPPDLGVVIFAKSTGARCGGIVPPTKAVPGWHGTLVIELFVAIPRPLIIRIGEGLATFAFYQLDSGTSGTELSTTSYSGQYQGQTPDYLGPRVAPLPESKE